MKTFKDLMKKYPALQIEETLNSVRMYDLETKKILYISQHRQKGISHRDMVKQAVQYFELVE